MKTLSLHKDAERRIFAGHLWIFSNDIDTKKSPLKQYHPGELVKIETAFGKKIAIGYINPQCLLCVRILSYDAQEKIDIEFFIKKITQAKSKREALFTEKYYRMVFGESDRLPGVVIDQFHDVIVAQINTAGMENLKPVLIDAIKTVFNPACILLKCDSSERANEGLTIYTEVIHGDLPNTIDIKENNFHYQISLLE